MQFANDSWRIQQSIFTLGYFEHIKMCKNIPLHYAQLCICNFFDFMNVDLEKSFKISNYVGNWISLDFLQLFFHLFKMLHCVKPQPSSNSTVQDCIYVPST